MRPLVLSSAQQAEAVDHLLLLRKLGVELVQVFSASGGSGAADARHGAEMMIQSINRLLELLDAPPELYQHAIPQEPEPTVSKGFLRGVRGRIASRDSEH